MQEMGADAYRTLKTSIKILAKAKPRLSTRIKQFVLSLSRPREVDVILFLDFEDKSLLVELPNNEQEIEKALEAFEQYIENCISEERQPSIIAWDVEEQQWTDFGM